VNLLRIDGHSIRGAIGGIGKLTLCNEIGWGQTEVKRDVFSLSLVLAGLGFVGYVVLTLKQKQPPATQPVTVPEAVLPSILTELDQRIHVRDGFIVVTEEPGVDTFLLPVSSQWLVRCGEGASIQLGAAANGSAGIL
jgi:hypothetical protein